MSTAPHTVVQLLLANLRRICQRLFLVARRFKLPNLKMRNPPLTILVWARCIVCMNITLYLSAALYSLIYFITAIFFTASRLHFSRSHNRQYCQGRQRDWHAAEHLMGVEIEPRARQYSQRLGARILRNSRSVLRRGLEVEWLCRGTSRKSEWQSPLSAVG